MRARALTMLEMLLAVALLSAFVAVYVSWSSAALRFTRTLDETGGEILADRALDWILRDYRDQVAPSAFQWADEEQQQADDDEEARRELEDDPAAGEFRDDERRDQERGTGGARRLAVTRYGLETFRPDADRIEVISPHRAPGEQPGFYEVSYYLRDGSLWRRARLLGDTARRITVTRYGSTTGDETELLRGVRRFDILPANEVNPRAGAVVTLELELESGETITRRRIIDRRREAR